MLTTEDQSLVESVTRGDTSAMRRLIDCFQIKVYNTILGMVHNREDAEELTQDVFVEIIHSVAAFKGESSLSTWIYRIAINKSLDFVKMRKRKKRFAFLSSLWGESNELVTDPPDFFHPGVALEKKEESVYFFKALDQLPESQRTAMVLAKLEGLSHEEISKVMKTSVSSVESLLFRARQNMRKILADYYQE